MTKMEMTATEQRKMIRHHGDARAFVRRMQCKGPIKTSLRVAKQLEVILHNLLDTEDSSRHVSLTFSYPLPLPCEDILFAKWIMYCVGQAWAHEGMESVLLDNESVMREHVLPDVPDIGAIV